MNHNLPLLSCNGVLGWDDLLLATGLPFCRGGGGRGGRGNFSRSLRDKSGFHSFYLTMIIFGVPTHSVLRFGFVERSSPHHSSTYQGLFSIDVP